MTIAHIATYKFVPLTTVMLTYWQKNLYDRALLLALKGTVLLSEEGMNLCLAGSKAAIQQFQDYLSKEPLWQDLFYNKTVSNEAPFRRLSVRIKKEIITLKEAGVAPTETPMPLLPPMLFKQWYEQKRDMVVLDTRNDYEVAMGTFASAIDLQLKTFGEFPKAVESLPDALKNKTVVAFCTGGIRCEKATVVLKNKGFRDVYQLAGGILNYFKECAGAYFNGDCFVFDERVALDTALKTVPTTLCRHCGQPACGQCTQTMVR